MRSSKYPSSVRVWRSGQKWQATVNGLVLPQELDTEGALRGAIKAELRKGGTEPVATSAREDNWTLEPPQHDPSRSRRQKLSPDQKTAALGMVTNGQRVSEIAATFNVHPATIYRYLAQALLPRR